MGVISINYIRCFKNSKIIEYNGNIILEQTGM
jgi:hypothetical protein